MEGSRDRLGPRLVVLLAMLAVCVGAVVWSVASHDPVPNTASVLDSVPSARRDGCRDIARDVEEYLRTGDSADLEVHVFGEDRDQILAMPSDEREDAIRKVVNFSVGVCACDEGNNPRFCDDLHDPVQPDRT